MKENKKVKISDNIKSKNGIFLLENETNKFIVLKSELLPHESDRSFEFIKYSEVEIEQENKIIKGVLLKFENEIYIEDIFHLLANRSDDNFYKLFSELNSLFKFQKEISLEEFRGDVGELLYIKNIGGIRTKNKFDTFDIFSNEGKQVEVKTYSGQQKTITISHEQLTQNNEIYIVELKKDDDGLTILEFAKEINDPEFSIYINKKYSNSIHRGYKFENIAPRILDWRPVLTELPNGIKSAKYIMNIEKPAT